MFKYLTARPNFVHKWHAARKQDYCVFHVEVKCACLIWSCSLWALSLFWSSEVTLPFLLLAQSATSVKCLRWDSLDKNKHQSNVFIRHQSTHQQLFIQQRTQSHSTTSTARGTSNLMEPYIEWGMWFWRCFFIIIIIVACVWVRGWVCVCVLGGSGSISCCRMLSNSLT